MIIEDIEGGGTRILLTDEEARPAIAASLDVIAWAAAHLPPSPGAPWGFESEGGAAVATFPDRPSALAFLGRFVPGALSDLARGIEAVAGDYHEIAERDGIVEVSIRYVGDAGGGDGDPADATWSDAAAYAEAARDLGFEPETLHTDHDTVEIRLVPAPPRPSLDAVGSEGDENASAAPGFPSR